MVQLDLKKFLFQQMFVRERLARGPRHLNKALSSRVLLKQETLATLAGNPRRHG